MSEHFNPISERQRAANIANAQLSTGPRTPEGKARSSQNARKHGFTAAGFSVVRLEDVEEVDHLKADLIHVYSPVNSQELLALERIALAQHALFRCARFEAGMFTDALNEALAPSGSPLILMEADLTVGLDVAVAQNRNFALAEGFYRIVSRNNHCWTLFLRYQAQTERLYRRAVEDFERIRRLRPELRNDDLPPGPPPADPDLPNEPISPPQPIDSAHASPSDQTYPSPIPPAPDPPQEPLSVSPPPPLRANPMDHRKPAAPNAPIHQGVPFAPPRHRCKHLPRETGRMRAKCYPGKSSHDWCTRFESRFCQPGLPQKPGR